MWLQSLEGQVDYWADLMSFSTHPASILGNVNLAYEPSFPAE